MRRHEKQPRHACVCLSCRNALQSEAIDVAVALVLFFFEVMAWLVERWTACVVGWRFYHKIVSYLLFKLYYREVTIVDPHSVLKSHAHDRLIFCSNHPTGLLDRLLIQHISPQPCFCLTQNWFAHLAGNAGSTCAACVQGERHSRGP